ncbi:MAG: hypothetical protein WD757_09955 [Actinomycetota bacterium]
MDQVGLFQRFYRNLHRDQGGFTVIETMVGLLILFIAVMATAYTATVGFRYAALARQRQAANSESTSVMEQVRALAFDTVAEGMRESDVQANASEDSNIGTSSCPNGSNYCVTIPGTNDVESIITSSTQAVSPLYPYEGQISSDVGTDFARKVYVSDYENAGDAYRVTVVVDWDQSAVEGAEDEVVLTSVFANTSGGCLGTSTHPFSGPCSTYLYGQSLIPEGSITLSGTIAGVPDFESATVLLPTVAGNTQSEQVQLVQGKERSSGVELTSTASDDVEDFGLVTLATQSDNDQGLPDLPYDKKTLSANGPDATGDVQVGSSSGPHLHAMKSSADSTGDSASTINAATASGAGQACGTQTDNQACSYASSQNGPITLQLHLYKGSTDLGSCDLVRVASAPTASSASIDRTGDSSNTSNNPNVVSTTTRTFGAVTIGCLPANISVFPTGWGGTSSVGGGSGFLVRIADGYTQGNSNCPVVTRAGYGVSAASVGGRSNSGTNSCSNANAPKVHYWDGSSVSAGSYSSHSHSGSGSYTQPDASPAAQFGATRLVYTPSSGPASGCTFTQRIVSGTTVVSGASTASNTGSSPISDSTATFVAPLDGTFQFTVTCPTEGTLVDLNIDSDLGTMKASANYSPPPS